MSVGAGREPVAQPGHDREAPPAPGPAPGPVHIPAAAGNRAVASLISRRAAASGHGDVAGMPAPLPLMAVAGSHFDAPSAVGARVLQRNGGGATAVAPTAGEVPNDEETARLVEGQPPAFTGIAFWPQLGGLDGMRRSLPKTFALIQPRAVAQYGQRAVDWMTRNDARLLALARASSALRSRASELSDRYAREEKRVAYDYVWEMLKQYDFGYARALDGYAKAGDAALTLWESMLQGSVADTLAIIRSSAEGAQADEDERSRLFEERATVGRAAVGLKVAERERLLIWDESLTLTELLRPEDGEDTEEKALAAARITGKAGAVLKQKDRWYVLALSNQLGFSDIWEQKAFQEHRSRIVPRGTPVSAIVTTDGYVLRPRGERFFGGDLSTAPESHVAGDEALLGERAHTLSDDEMLTLFKRMTLDVVLANLAAAEHRLKEAQGRLAPDLQMDPAAGAKLQQNTAALRRHMLAAGRVAAEMDGAEPTPAQLREAENVLAAIGRIVSEDPSAAMMVKSDRDKDATGPPAESDVTDRLAGKKSGDAADEALTEIKARLDNVETIRLHLLSHPDAVLSLHPVHDEVLMRFPPDKAAELRTQVMLHDLGELAASMGILLADLTLLVVGVLAGGPVGLVAWGLSAGAGVVQTGAALDDAARLKAMSKLDVEGGFALATPEQAESARNWAYIGLALTVLDLGLLGRSVSKMARLRSVLASPELASVLTEGERSLAPVAEKLGMTERALLRELETAEGPARARLIERMREAAGAINTGAKAGAKSSTWLGKSVEEVAKIREELMARGDVGRMTERLAELGVDADRETVMLVKRHLFTSPGIDFLEENYRVWTRLAAGGGSVEDAQILAHELAEVRELRLLQTRTPGFDFLGKGYESMSAAQRQRWHADFNRLYGEAHAKALEAEFDYLAQQVRQATNGRYPATRARMAAVDPTPFGSPRSREAAQYMLVDGVPLRDHPRFYEWQAAGRELVEVPTATRTRLGLPETGGIRLDDLVAAVKRTRPT